MPQVSRAQTATPEDAGSWGKADVFNEMAEDYVTRQRDGRGPAAHRLSDRRLSRASFQVFDGVHGGRSTRHTRDGLLVRQAQAASLFGTGPVFGFNAMKVLAVFTTGRWQELFEELQTQIMKVNIKSSFAMPTTSRSAGSKAIPSDGRLKGLKYRTVGLAADCSR